MNKMKVNIIIISIFLIFSSISCRPDIQNPDPTQIDPPHKPTPTLSVLTDEEAQTLIIDFVEARDFLAGYFNQEYGVMYNEDWISQEITAENENEISTYRYVSGPLTIVISAKKEISDRSIFIISEASDISNGFYWEGELSKDGKISESALSPPGEITSDIQARDAVMDFIISSYDLPPYSTWTDQGVSQTESGSAKRVYTSDAWVATVIFEPAAPLVSNYQVIVDNLKEGIRWEGDITLLGEITENSYKISE